MKNFLPSTTVVGGEGGLYDSRNKLNLTGRDFPAEYRDKISGEEMILWILESIKMRTGGDEDILSHR